MQETVNKVFLNQPFPKKETLFSPDVILGALCRKYQNKKNYGLWAQPSVIWKYIMWALEMGYFAVHREGNQKEMVTCSGFLPFFFLLSV